MGGGTGFCTQGIVQAVRPTNVTLIDQSPHQLAKAKRKADLQGVTVLEVGMLGPQCCWLGMRRLHHEVLTCGCSVGGIQ